MMPSLRPTPSDLHDEPAQLSALDVYVNRMSQILSERMASTLDDLLERERSLRFLHPDPPAMNP